MDRWQLPPLADDTAADAADEAEGAAAVVAATGRRSRAEAALRRHAAPEPLATDEADRAAERRAEDSMVIYGSRRCAEDQVMSQGVI